jgi:signal transduction histidine kinase/CheY-like chemotaxis protein
MTALLVEALFAVVFARALVAYLRGRDPLQRDVTFVFGSVAALFALDVARRLGLEPSQLVSDMASALLLAQPALALRLVARVRSVPGWMRWAAAVGWLASAAVVIGLHGAPLPVAGIVAIVVVFCAVEVTAAVFLIREATHRAGSSRVRLYYAAAGTALFAVAVLVAAAGPAAGPAAQVIALVSVLGFALAFLPPRWLRQLWAARAGLLLTRRLLAAPANEPPTATWQRYADSVGELSTADAAVVLLPAGDGQVSQAAVYGLPAEPVITAGIGQLEALLRTLGTHPAPRTDRSDAGEAGPGCPGPGDDQAPSAALTERIADGLAAALARRAGAHYLTVAALPLPSGGCGALVLLTARRSLFSDDDVQLFGELGAQAAIVADRQALTAELAVAVDAATAASRAKSTFMANMSHELRTPLNAIIGFSDLMRDERSEGNDRLVSLDWISHINGSGQHLLGLINDVLDLSKVEAGHLELQLVALDASAAVDEAVTALQPLVHGKHLEVIVAVPPLPLRADPIRLRQILTNLLSNAIKFTPDGGRIFVAAQRVGGQIQLSVTDTGPGIDPADQQRVFEEFQQVGDPSMHRAGTGLGLALTRRLVQAHGGRIDLHSEPGRGARFTIHLPAPTATENETEPLIDTTDDQAAGGTGGILIVEDNVAAAELLATHLRRAGYPVTIAANGETGLALAATVDPDIILLDVNLPGIDGWDVMRHLKTDPHLRHIPVAVISVADHHAVGLALGAVDYFVKPINHDVLLAWLVRHGMIPPVAADDTAVLVIDDDPAVLTLMDRTLNRHGVRVVGVGSGTDGLRLARRHRFDLIICDLVMPDIDGFTVIAALHDDPATRHIPVLVLTAHDITEADKTRLSGKILGFTAKGRTAPAIVQDWIDTITRRTADTLADSSPA